MIHELAHEGGPGRVRGVVRIVHAEDRVHDKGHGASGEIVLRVQNAPRFADVPQRGLECRARRREGRELGEDATESVFPEDESTTLMLRVSGRRGEKARRDGRHGTSADRPQKRPPTDPPHLIGVHSSSYLVGKPTGFGPRTLSQTLQGRGRSPLTVKGPRHYRHYRRVRAWRLGVPLDHRQVL